MGEQIGKFPYANSFAILDSVSGETDFSISNSDAVELNFDSDNVKVHLCTSPDQTYDLKIRIS